MRRPVKLISQEQQDSFIFLSPGIVEIANELAMARAVLEQQAGQREQKLTSHSNVSLDLELRIREQQDYIRSLEKKRTQTKQPVINLDIQHDRPVQDEEFHVHLTLRNDGYGPAHNLIVYAAFDPFGENEAATAPIATLQVGDERARQLSLRPRVHGGSVPLQLRLEYADHTGKGHAGEQTLSLSVAARLPLPATTHVLSFDRLSPADFERLCLWLVEREGYTAGQHLGLAGREQGRDVVAYKLTPQGEELWYFQCKRYRSIGAANLRGEIDKLLSLTSEKPHLWPKGVVFVVSCAISARVREEVEAYCGQANLDVEFWALTELDMRVKRHPELLREFFSQDR